MIIAIYHDIQNTLSKVIFKMVFLNSAEFLNCKLSRGNNLYYIIKVRYK